MMLHFKSNYISFCLYIDWRKHLFAIVCLCLCPQAGVDSSRVQHPDTSQSHVSLPFSPLTLGFCVGSVHFSTAPLSLLSLMTFFDDVKPSV